VNLLDFAYTPIYEESRIALFDLVSTDFIEAKAYVGADWDVLVQVHQQCRGVIYGVEPTEGGRRLLLSAGLVNAGGRFSLPQTRIGVVPNTTGYLILGPDGVLRVGSAADYYNSATLGYFYHDGTTLGFDTDARMDAVQLRQATETGSVADIAVPEGVTRTYTIDHDTVYRIPGYVTASIDAGFTARFLKDTETPTSIQIEVVQTDDEAPAGTLAFTRTGLAVITDWY